MTATDWLWIAILTLILEAATCFLRFGMNLRASKDTRFFSRFTSGIRVHHGYFGVLMLAPAALFPVSEPLVLGIRLGGALALSDLIHHFLVLWPITGSHEFDLRYPKQ